MNENDSPFAAPMLQCRNCGRSDDHVYCDRLLPWVVVFLGALALVALLTVVFL